MEVLGSRGLLGEFQDMMFVKRSAPCLARGSGWMNGSHVTGERGGRRRKGREEGGERGRGRIGRGGEANEDTRSLALICLSFRLPTRLM